MYIERQRVILLKILYNDTFSEHIYYFLANCADPDEMTHMHFIWVFTISSVFSFSFFEKKSKSMSVLNNTKCCSFRLNSILIIYEGNVNINKLLFKAP